MSAPSHPSSLSTTSPANTQRRILNATLILMIFFLLSRISGLVREMIIAAQFGTGAALDAYQAAFRIPDLLFQLSAGGALGSAFIPTFSTFWVKADYEGAWLLFSRILNLVTVLLLVLTSLAALLALPLMRHVIAPGFEPAQQMLAASLMRWMLIGTVIFGASGLIMGALNTAQHFLLPAAAPVLYNLAIILGAWLLAPRWGVHGLVIGVVLGALAHFCVQLPGLWRQGVRYQFDFSMREANVREVMRLMGPRVLGLFFVQLHFLVNTILASGLAVGRISALSYAWMLMLLPQGIFAQSIATAAFPTFAAQIAAGDVAAMRRTLGQSLRTLLFLVLPAAVLLFVLSVPLVQMLLQRREFTLESTLLVAYALRFYAIGLLSHALLEIVVRAFYALHDTWTPVVVGVATMILNILLSLLLLRWFGHGGLALANSIATTLEMLLLTLLLRRRLGGLDEHSLFTAAGKSAVAAGIMGAACWLWLTLAERLADSWPILHSGWVQALGGTAIAAVVYLVAAALLNSEELRPALAIITRRK